ncbi:MAG: ATP-binding protein, partial [Actinobacteria bacterium]|nr:ATP-binding protein [Actinomycetota bacterium]
GLPPENAELKGQLEVIDREVDRLTRLVEELLDVSRLQSGRLSFRPAPLDLAELLSETIRQFQGRSGRLGVDLSLTVADTLPAVTADRDRIKQVLFNLLDNALKFTHPGGRVAVTAAAEGDGVLVKVEDTGEG